MRDGLVSGNNDCYCHITKFHDGVMVSCEKTKSGYSFRVWLDNANRTIPE